MLRLRISIPAVLAIEKGGSVLGFQCVASHRGSRVYKDQCISSKSTVWPRFASVSRRLMITAMAASSLLRLLSPGPTMLSKSSWEFSAAARWSDGKDG